MFRLSAGLSATDVRQKIANITSAVHNFCTSQKAAGLQMPQNFSGSGAHRGGAISSA
jgi:hypothetical protein